MTRTMAAKCLHTIFALGPPLDRQSGDGVVGYHVSLTHSRSPVRTRVAISCFVSGKGYDKAPSVDTTSLLWMHWSRHEAL